MSQILFLVSAVFAALLAHVAVASKPGTQEVNCLKIRENTSKFDPKPNNWIPECESNGTFKVLQRNVSGTPFCVTPKGVMVFQPTNVTATTTISCDCPLKFFDLLTHAHKMGSFVPFCDAKDGTYSATQCHPGTPAKRTGTCQCVDVNGQYLAEKPKEADQNYCLKYRLASKQV